VPLYYADLFATSALTYVRGHTIGKELKGSFNVGLCDMS